MNLLEKLKQILDKYNQIKTQLSAPFEDHDSFVKLSKEASELEPYVETISELLKLSKDKSDLEAIIADPNADSELSTLAKEEITEISIRIPELEQQLKTLLVPKDIDDEKNAIVEIRAGTGGDEAGLFAGELYRMYQKYAEIRGWSFEKLYFNENELGSLREAAAVISGRGVFARLKFESGVHRVQRVPVTESGGRVHTSTATVAVMPEVEEVQMNIDPKDLKIDVMRASGAGGQHINKTESAVRITHIPTGIVVMQQDERSQHMNKLKAMKILCSRLYEFESKKINEERAKTRRDQIGTGERNERIRTYNFPQGRVTEHRIGLTIYKLDRVMSGEELDGLINPLIEADQEAKLAADFEV